MSNDAKGCYDCIAHVVVDLALRRLGIPKPALQSMIEAIQNMEHHIRTAFGDSEEHYGNDGGPPPQVLLQGNGTGPAGWYSIAHLMIKILQGMGFGYNAITPIFQRAFQITCFAFVDDTNIVHATTDPDKPSADLIQEAQTALTKWEDLLRATGGALAPEKSYWYFLNVIQKGGHWVYARPTDNNFTLQLGNGYVIQRHHMDTSQEALGIQIRPDCSMADEKQVPIG